MYAWGDWKTEGRLDLPPPLPSLSSHAYTLPLLLALKSVFVMQSNKIFGDVFNYGLEERTANAGVACGTLLLL